jgi:hypothetical protein
VDAAKCAESAASNPVCLFALLEVPHISVRLFALIDSPLIEQKIKEIATVNHGWEFGPEHHLSGSYWQRFWASASVRMDVSAVTHTLLCICLLLRMQDMKLRRAVSMTMSRAVSFCPENVAAFFDSLRKVMQEYDITRAEQIWNMDETQGNDTRLCAGFKVAAKKGGKPITVQPPMT